MLQIGDLRDGYRQIIAWVLAEGRPVAPRGVPTIEVADAVIKLRNPRDALPVGVGRQLKSALAAIEALQLIGGFSDPALVTRIAPRTAQFLDGGSFHGAYGPRLRQQLPAVAHRLQSDSATRRAVATLWDPAHDLHDDDLHDYPCTMSVQFMVRDDLLELHVSMRSNDVWLGLAYDAFVFTQLQLSMARWLGITPGAYFHHATSLHLYDHDREQAMALSAPTGGTVAADGIGDSSATVADNMAAARALVYRQRRPSTLSEDWYADRLAPFME